MGAQQRMEIEVAGVVDQHRVAGLEQEAAQQVDRLRAGFGQHDLVRRRLDAALTPCAAPAADAGRQAERRAVVGQRRTVGPRQRSQRPAHAVFRHPGRRQPAATGLQNGIAGLERLPRDPERIDRPVELRSDFRQRQRRRLAGDVEPGPRRETDHAFGDQPLIGLDDRGLRDLQRRRECPDRRQLRARRQAAPGDALPDRRP